MTRKNVSSTYTDPSTGKFRKGNPGRPQGARHMSSRAIEKLFEGDAEALGRMAVELALAGDTAALRLCLERIVPLRKDAPVEFALPAMVNAKEAATAAQALIEGVSQGDLTPSEAAAIMGLIERYGRLLELSELEGRLVALERATKLSAK